MTKVQKTINNLNSAIARVDVFPLWWMGFVFILILLLPNLLMGEGSVFTIHDQLDESMMNYVLTTRHIGQNYIPEMLGGISYSGIQPSSLLFLPIYLCMTPFWAFLCTYGILLVVGFFGMYACVRKLTGSNTLAMLMSCCFCMLPLYPVYGLSQMGIPMVLYAMICLNEVETPSFNTLFVPFLLVVVFALSTHLIYTGYVVLAFWTLALFVALLKRQVNVWSCVGFCVLLLTYLMVNARLLIEIVFGKGLNGQAAFVSHREEMVNNALPFFPTVKEVFLDSAQHAPAHHKNLILPIVLLLILGAVFYKNLCREAKRRYQYAMIGFVVLVAVAVFYGVCKSELIVNWKNGLTGFVRYFQAERFYWIYPAGWYLEFALVCSFGWTVGKKQGNVEDLWHFLYCPLVQMIIIGLVLFPTAKTIIYDSDFYRNVNQYNNGTQVTGYITWEDYYAEELMARLEEVIGREMSEYRIAHLGISPAPALMHGFYTVDGYSNNYPLAYKHAFREVIARELNKSPQTASYFDSWGNRCYLFNSQTGTYWMMKKGSGVVYQDLDFDMNALSSLGCEYIFSGGEIADPEDMGLELMGYFEAQKSYWGIWLYKLQ